MTSRFIAISIAASVLALIGGIEGFGVWSSKKTVQRLCKTRELPKILSSKDWVMWSSMIRAVTGPEGINDPEQRIEMVALARREGISLRSTAGYPYSFPNDGVWSERLELLKNGQPIASINQYMATDMGPLERAILGDGIGTRHGCGNSNRQFRYYDLTGHEFVVVGGLPTEDFSWGEDE